MGYDVHITRAKDWLDSELHPISLEEWCAYVNRDPEMRLDGHAEASLPNGEVLRMESAGLAVWKAYAGRDANGNEAWFYYYDYRIIVKNPDKGILQKMRIIASELGARVIGDEGEEY